MQNPIPKPNFFGLDLFNLLKDSSGEVGAFGRLILEIAGPVSAILQVVLVILAAVSAFLIVYYYNKLEDLDKLEREKARSKDDSEPEGTFEESLRESWEKVQIHMGKGEETEWKLAIVEADIILDKALKHLGYTGETVADNLKLLDDEGFRLIDEAWKAHKVRNRIAHDGSAFSLTRAEADYYVALYTRVFAELGVLR